MAYLSARARERLRLSKVTPEEWARRWFDSPTWSGDHCGCPDDRCEGYHHEAGDACGCLDSLLRS